MTRLNFGFRGHDITGARTPEALADGLAQQGARNVQLALAKSFPDMNSEAGAINPGMGAVIRRTLASRGVEIAVLGCYINMIHPDLEVRETLLRRFEAHVANARYFGAPIVASETGSVIPNLGQYTERNFTEETYRDTLDVIRRLVAAGERYGTIVGIEPGVNHPIHDLDTVERLIADVDSPYLGIVFDATALTPAWQASPEWQLELTRQAFRRFGERICAMHIADWRLDGDGGDAGAAPSIRRVAAGTGRMPVREILAIAEASKPCLTTIFEHTENDAMSQALAWFA
ncbi:sugar phosphate isomerase/epimerase family protein [Bifidobacterium callimiconis]|uniref:Xylose isomerase n=1 Tax=Bifidobacterium callimiconis TaxID=2306973 RepID=A0A430FGE1_9BIFI|nr:sugar phosphate isomerase/epimerase [Bifidobacterium callimiconis]RSX51887.1 xylose isomerase [Bifidobacterium callimiconis]